MGEKPGYPDWHTYAIRDVKTNVCLASVGNVDRYFEKNNEANARLISQAPALLNALEVAEATINRLERHAPGSANGTLDVIRAAIAEAT